MDIIEVLRDLIFYLGLMTPECFESLVVDLDFSNVSCLKLAISKALGLGIVVGSSLVKLPQVLKIAGSGSADGISFLGILLELIAITFSGVYSYSNNFPFSSYGESVFLAIQTTVIGLLVLAFSQGKLKAILFGALYAGAVWSLMNPVITPVELLWYGQAANIPMILLGKLIQIMTNFRNGHTGQLSAVTCFLLSLGAIARIFTSVQETGDNIVILTYVCSSVVNTIIALQVIFYWNSTSEATKLKKQ
jgi:mannose-P-dolichol utilization defect protein 1